MNGEELIDSNGRNPTQRLIDEEADPAAPVDEPWAVGDGDLEELEEVEPE